MKKLFLLTFALLGLGLLTSCGGNAKYLEEPIKDARFYTGYYVQISIYDKGKRQALEDAFDLMEKQTRKIEINEQGLSEIDNVNNASGKKAVEVSKDVYGLLDETLQFAKKTDGAFNPAIGVSSLLWHIGFPDANVPNEEFLTAAQKLLNYEDIELNEANQSVFLKKEGMKLDLGGVGK
ncbi:MAG: FAD:protein FMN transferase, partial [Streptococcaceae bacterium]|nr:FAD:protein FMN transferase [Streptococcaceae bacterium]